MTDSLDTAREAGNRPRVRVLISAAAAVTLLAGTAAWWYFSGLESTDDAQIDGRIVQVAARVSGTVTAIAVRDNQPVHTGDVLIELDPRELRIALDHARAELADAEAEARAAATAVPIASTTTASGVSNAQAGVQQAAGGVESAAKSVEAAAARLRSMAARLRELEATAIKARRDRERLESLVAKEEIARQQYDAAVAAADAADAAVDGARAELAEAETAIRVAEAQLSQARSAEQQSRASLAVARVQPREVEVLQARSDAARARAERARAVVAQAEVDLEHASVLARTDGVVSRRSVEVGQLVQVGQPLLALVQLGDVWVTANFKETQLERMRPGQRAVVEVDSYGGREYQATVESIAAATGARFSLLPPENATGNFIKVVQRVPVKLVLQQGQDDEQLLRPGMSVVATVDTR
ncbi:MAG: efflux RND transporter periplasmic adaptor subunit [Vicinamibacterales bacterium]